MADDGEKPAGWRAAEVWVVPGLMLAAVAALVLVSHGNHEVSASDRGSLTPEQYLNAVHIARTEIAQEDAEVSTAVATIARRTPDIPTGTPGCTSDRLLVVSLVGRFPDIRLGFPEPQPGPDTWVTVRADPTTGQECLSGASRGHFTAPAGAADLAPAL